MLAQSPQDFLTALACNQIYGRSDMIEACQTARQLKDRFLPWDSHELPGLRKEMDLALTQLQIITPTEIDAKVQEIKSNPLYAEFLPAEKLP